MSEDRRRDFTSCFYIDIQIFVDVELSLIAGTGSTTGVTINAVGAKSGYPFNGVAGDFVIKNAAGVTQAISAATSEDGNNVLTATLVAGTYTANLVDPADMVTKGFESTGSVEFTVPA